MTARPCAHPRCPALADEPSAFCAGHRSSATRVPFSGARPPVICDRCGQEIKPGHWQKVYAGKAVHAGYICTPKAESLFVEDGR